MSKSYNENDGMFSEHLILISAISVSRANIKRVLEIGTHNGRTALILSHLFRTPKSLVLTCHLMILSSSTLIIEIVPLMNLLMRMPILLKPRTSILEK